MAFQSFIRNWKDRTGWTDERIAAACEVGHVTVNGWVNGRTLPKLENIPKIAEMTGVDWREVAALVLGQTSGAGPAMRPELAALLAKAASLTDGELNRVSDVVEAMFPDRIIAGAGPD